MKDQRIILLEVEQFKKITAFRATFDDKGGLVILTGPNGAGKSSILESIEAAITGKLPAEPLHRGAESGRIVCKTPDFVLSYRFTQKGAYFELSNPEGAVFKSPRAMLASFYQSIAFDPLAFSLMKEKDQTEALLRLCPVKLDLAKNAAESKRLYDDRAMSNREVKRLEAHLKSLPEPGKDVPEPVSVLELTGKLEELREQERSNQTKRNEREMAIQQQEGVILAIERADGEIAELEKKLQQLGERRRNLIASHTANATKIVESDKTIALLPDLLPIANEIKAKIADAEKVNRLVEEHKQATNAILDAQRSLEDATKEASELDTALQNTQRARADALKEASFPVPGLSISNEGVVLLNEIPFSQASTAEQIRLGVGLAAAANPTIKVAFVKDGSLLDDKSKLALKELAEKHELQVFVERIVDTDPQSITIHDGTNVVDGSAPNP